MDLRYFFPNSHSKDDSKLTNRLDTKQKRIRNFLVYKNLFFCIIFFSLPFFISFCGSAGSEKVKNQKKMCSTIPVSLFTILPEHNIPEKLIFHKEETLWIQHYRKQFSEIFSAIDKEKNRSSKTCNDELVISFQREWKVYEKLLHLYYGTMEKQLVMYLEENKIYGKEEILLDFQENRHAIHESLFQYASAVLDYFHDNASQREIRYWWETYTIFLFELYATLPDGFKEGWVRKSNLSPY